MDTLTIFALLPVALILYYIYKKDSRPEPFKTLAITFLLGCATVLPACLAENFFATDNVFVENYCVVAPAEEFFKMLVVMLYIWKHKDFDDSYDAIVYCVMASLGFAAVENVMYVFSNENGLMVALLRAVLSIPGHTVFAVFMGYFVAVAKTHFYYGRRGKQWACLAAALFTAVMVHGTYDFLLSGEDGEYMGLFAIFVIVTDVFAFLLVRKASRDDHPMIQDFN